MRFKSIFYAAFFLLVLLGIGCSSVLGSEKPKKENEEKLAFLGVDELHRLIKKLVKPKYLKHTESSDLFFAIFNNVRQYAKRDGKSEKERILWAQEKVQEFYKYCKKKENLRECKKELPLWCELLSFNLDVYRIEPNSQRVVGAIFWEYGLTVVKKIPEKDICDLMLMNIEEAYEVSEIKEFDYSEKFETQVLVSERLGKKVRTVKTPIEGWCRGKQKSWLPEFTEWPNPIKRGSYQRLLPETRKVAEEALGKKLQVEVPKRSERKNSKPKILDQENQFPLSLVKYVIN